MTGSVVVGSNTGGEKDGFCFLERSLGSCDLSRSWIGSSGCFGFFGFSMLKGALEAVRVVTAALFSHSGVEHLEACCAPLGMWCGQDGRSYGYSGLLAWGWPSSCSDRSSASPGEQLQTEGRQP